MPTKEFDHQYDFGVQGQGQTDLKFELPFLTQNHSSFLDEVDHTFYDDCLWCFDDNQCF